jgi:hypothetical protein
MAVAFLPQAICPVLVLVVGGDLGTVVRPQCARVFHLGRNLFAVPRDRGGLFGTRHATSNYAVLYTAKGVASISGGWVGALLFERFGSWSMGFYGSAAMALVAAAMAVGLRAKAAANRAPIGVPLAAK